MSENVFVTTTRAGGEESGEVVSLSSPRVLDPRLPSGTHLTPLGLFLKFCTSRVSSSFNLKREKKKKKGNAQAEIPFTELKQSKGSFDGYQ